MFLAQETQALLPAELSLSVLDTLPPAAPTKKPRKTATSKKKVTSPPSAAALSSPSDTTFASFAMDTELIVTSTALTDTTEFKAELDRSRLLPTLDLSTLTESNLSIVAPTTTTASPPANEECVKKRGRKPQGGKIIKKTKVLEPSEEVRASVILHLKCFLKDLDTDMLDVHCPVQPYTEDPMTTCYKSLKEVEAPFTGKSLHTKIKELEQNLHTNNVNDKKSGCFHCTCTFENMPYYIPKCNLHGTYQVYGCFCMPECAAAYLFKEPIDNTVKFDRYYMLNHLYGKANGYTQNIKLAPSPYYFLDKFYGNLSVSEYRSLFKKEKYYFMVDKPLTRVMPEIYEDNDTHVIHNKFVNAHNKFKAKAQSKNAILHETFNAAH